MTILIIFNNLELFFAKKQWKLNHRTLPAVAATLLLRVMPLEDPDEQHKIAWMSSEERRVKQ